MPPTDETNADSELELEATQSLDDFEPTDANATNETNTNVANATNETNTNANDANADDANTNDAGESFAFAGASASAAPFMGAFGVVWRALLSLGWQTAQGPGTEFVSMPGTQFFNFRPNINVFDAKGKACWKWLASAAEREPVGRKEEDKVWDALWAVAETQLGWYTMSSGDETWFVKPKTQFAEFQPNVTIFQTKKRAVLQAFKTSKVRIELGDSVEGPQVIDFAAEPQEPKTKKEKKASDTPKASRSKSDAFTTPPPKKSASAASSTKKTAKATPTPSKKLGKSSGAGSAKKTTPAKTPNAKSPKASASSKKKSEPPLVFHAPEFKCTFGHVYKRLQDRGWYHKAGSFEYDYFSPDWTKETAILNGNYFQSAAEFESFLKDSGMWADIEGELRDEHAAVVEELRQEAEEKRQKLKERQAAKEAAEKANKSKAKSTPGKDLSSVMRSPSKKKKISVFQKASQMTAMKRKSLEPEDRPAVKITMGKIVDKLVKRGWHYKPGRFEYDYYKPNVNIKTAKVGEDYFQSESELETYLKVSGLWTEIAHEIRQEFEAGTDEEDDNKQKAKKTTPTSNKKPRVETKEPVTPTSPREEKGEKEAESEPLEPAAVALPNDIWGNANQFDFEKY